MAHLPVLQTSGPFAVHFFSQVIPQTASGSAANPRHPLALLARDTKIRMLREMECMVFPSHRSTAPALPTAIWRVIAFVEHASQKSLDAFLVALEREAKGQTFTLGCKPRVRDFGVAARVMNAAGLLRFRLLTEPLTRLALATGRINPPPLQTLKARVSEAAAAGSVTTVGPGTFDVEHFHGFLTRYLLVNKRVYEPVGMLNLLSFKEPAGANSYAKYSQGVLPMAIKRGSWPIFVALDVVEYEVDVPGGKVVEKRSYWDEVAIMEYPGAFAFAEMAQSDEMREIAQFRTEGLDDTSVMATHDVRNGGLPVVGKL